MTNTSDFFPGVDRGVTGTHTRQAAGIGCPKVCPAATIIPITREVIIPPPRSVAIVVGLLCRQNGVSSIEDKSNNSAGGAQHGPREGVCWLAVAGGSVEGRQSVPSPQHRVVVTNRVGVVPGDAIVVATRGTETATWRRAGTYIVPGVRVERRKQTASPGVPYVAQETRRSGGKIAGKNEREHEAPTAELGR